jgi:hypothetical protein
MILAYQKQPDDPVARAMYARALAANPEVHKVLGLETQMPTSAELVYALSALNLVLKKPHAPTTPEDLQSLAAVSAGVCALQSKDNPGA